VRRPLALAVAGVLVVGAALVSWSAPSPEQVQGPMAVTARVGEPATGRTLRVTVERIRLARAVRGGDWEGSTPGVWLVVRVRAEARLQATSLTGTVTVGDRSWTASERPPTSIGAELLDAGLPMEGDLLFELPRSALGGDAELEIATSSSIRLDSAVRVRLDLSRLAVQDRLTTEDPELVTS